MLWLQQVWKDNPIGAGQPGQQTHNTGDLDFISWKYQKECDSNLPMGDVWGYKNDRIRTVMVIESSTKKERHLSTMRPGCIMVSRVMETRVTTNSTDKL